MEISIKMETIPAIDNSKDSENIPQRKPILAAKFTMVCHYCFFELFIELFL